MNLHKGGTHLRPWMQTSQWGLEAVNSHEGGMCPRQVRWAFFFLRGSLFPGQKRSKDRLLCIPVWPGRVEGWNRREGWRRHRWQLQLCTLGPTLSCAFKWSKQIVEQSRAECCLMQVCERIVNGNGSSEHRSTQRRNNTLTAWVLIQKTAVS